MSAPFKLSLGTKRPAPGSARPPPSRSSQPAPKALLSQPNEDDDDNNEDSSRITQHISEFGQTIGAGAEEAAPVRVIQSIPNRDWRAESKRKRQKSGLPAEAQGQTQARARAQQNGDAKEDAVKENTPSYGLTVVERRRDEEEAAGSVEETHEEIEIAEAPQTVEQEALDALINGQQKTAVTTIAPPTPPLTEDDAFKNDFRSAPRSATLDEYAATPIEGFGEAILRGYLKPGQTLVLGDDEKSGQKGKFVVKKRAGLLGIGAKESGLKAEELGAWNKGRQKGAKEEIGYTPVAMRNRRTGEVVTEVELQKKLAEQKGVMLSLDGDEKSGRNGKELRGHAENDREREYEKEDRDHDRRSDRHRHGYGDKNGGYRHEPRRKNREHNQERDRDGHHHSRRARSSSRDRHSQRQYDGERDGDKAYHERKERERRQRHRERDEYRSSEYEWRTHGDERRRR